MYVHNIYSMKLKSDIYRARCWTGTAHSPRAHEITLFFLVGSCCTCLFSIFLCCISCNIFSLVLFIGMALSFYFWLLLVWMSLWYLSTLFYSSLLLDMIRILVWFKNDIWETCFAFFRLPLTDQQKLLSTSLVYDF